MCNLNAIDNPIDVSFDACRQSLRDTYPLETRVSILQYYNVSFLFSHGRSLVLMITLQLCSQAGLQPEGLPVALEATWRDLSSRCPVPAGSSSVSASFPKAIPAPFSVVFNSPPVSTSLLSAGRSSPTRAVSASKHDATSAAKVSPLLTFKNSTDSRHFRPLMCFLYSSGESLHQSWSGLCLSYWGS